MARPRKVPADLRWFREYLCKLDLELTPEQALVEMDAEQWQRMQSAWRQRKAAVGRQGEPQLSSESWLALQMVARRMGGITVEAAIERLAKLPPGFLLEATRKVV